MKGWLRLGILFLIITSCIVVVNAAPTSNSDCGKTVQAGTIVDISRCVSSTDSIGWWPDGANKNKYAPSAFFTFSGDLHTYDTSEMYLGNYYVLSQKLTATKKVLTIV
jgi:hypothetical protein